jgi:hypothetical protein
MDGKRITARPPIRCRREPRNKLEAPTWTFAGPAVFSPIHGIPPSANIIRIVNPSDLVPKIPVPPLYQHIGQEVDVSGAADQFNFALQHSLDT